MTSEIGRKIHPDGLCHTLAASLHLQEKYLKQYYGGERPTPETLQKLLHDERLLIFSRDIITPMQVSSDHLH